ncbi:hypothetical protein RQP46_007253 [Phenoliferia psychrophenolica]
MHALQVLAFLLPLARLAASSAIIVPLYFDPDPISCFPELRSAASANPSLSFVLILNPDSGPGTSLTSAQMGCIPALRAAIPTAKIIGYVATGYGTRNTSLVQRDIRTYRGWAKAKEGRARVPIDGIFLDEVSNDPGHKTYTKYTSYRAYVKKAFGDSAYLVMNPGASVSPRFFSLADLLVTSESSYANFNGSLISKAYNTPLSQQAIIIHSFPPQLTTGKFDMETVLSSFVPAVGAIYITDRVFPDVNVYGAFGGDWKDFVGEVVTHNSETPPPAPAAT